jgi:hypothetical protein
MNNLEAMREKEALPEEVQGAIEEAWEMARDTCPVYYR